MTSFHQGKDRNDRRPPLESTRAPDPAAPVTEPSAPVTEPAAPAAGMDDIHSLSTPPPVAELNCSLSVSTKPVTAPVSAEPDNSSRSSSVLGDFWRSTLGSPGTYVFSGVTIQLFSSGQPLSAATFAAFTLLGIVNRFRYYQRGGEIDSGTGLFDKAKRFVTSPHIDFQCAAFWFLGAAGEAAYHYSLLVIPNIVYSCGEYCAGKLQERKAEAQRKSQDPSDSANEIRSIWSAVQNPVQYFAVGNILFNLIKGGFSNPGLYPGLLLAGAAAVVAGKESVTGDGEPSGLAFKIHALSQATFGIYHLCMGNLPLAAAFFIFVPSAMMQARDQAQLRRGNARISTFPSKNGSTFS